MSAGEKAEKTDPMADMLSRIRAGNVTLKKVDSASPKATNKPGNVMTEMAKLLVSDEQHTHTHTSSNSCVV